MVNKVEIFSKFINFVLPINVSKLIDEKMQRIEESRLNSWPSDGRQVIVEVQHKQLVFYDFMVVQIQTYLIQHNTLTMSENMLFS